MDANRILRTIVMDVENLTADENLINFDQLDRGYIDEWVDALKVGRRRLGRFIRKLEAEKTSLSYAAFHATLKRVQDRTAALSLQEVCNPKETVPTGMTD